MVQGSDIHGKSNDSLSTNSVFVFYVLEEWLNGTAVVHFIAIGIFGHCFRCLVYIFAPTFVWVFFISSLLFGFL